LALKHLNSKSGCPFKVVRLLIQACSRWEKDLFFLTI